MHELFAQVLSEKDLSKAGDLFSVEDKAIEQDLSELLKKIQNITDSPDYLTNTNDQSVVEICVTRVTSAIRETSSIEAHAAALISLLESCLQHDLAPTSKDEDTPHAKIASDIMSCVFLNYSKKPVMELALPVAVKFLHQGNKELSRNMASYLSLAAIDNAHLLSQHTEPIIASIIKGNTSLARVLPQIYTESKEPINKHMSKLVVLLLDCETAEKNSFLQLCGLVAKEKPSLLEEHIEQFCNYLSSSTTSAAMLQAFIHMATANATPFRSHLTLLKQTAEQQPATLGLVAKIIGAVGKLSSEVASECVAYLASQLSTADNNTLPLLLKEIKAICDLYPPVLSSHMREISPYSDSTSLAARMVVQQLKDLYAKNKSFINNQGASSPREIKPSGSQTVGPVTVIAVGNTTSSIKTDTVTVTSPHTHMVTPDNKLQSVSSITSPNDKSTSTRNISTDSNKQESLHAADYFVENVHLKERNSESLRTVDRVSESGRSVEKSYGDSSRNAEKTVESGNHGNGVNVIRCNTSLVSSPGTSGASTSRQQMSTVGMVDLRFPANKRSSSMQTSTSVHSSDDKSVTISSGHSVSSNYAAQLHAIPYRDAVQQFCEKHLNKIKAFIANVSARLPIPIKASLEESKHKRYCRLHFICLGQSEDCLYSRHFFTMKTKLPRIWIHLMFLAIQSRSESAVCQQDPSVGNLKVCWDSLKLDSGNSFVRLVTSSFPSSKDQDSLLHELNSVRYFDVFEFNGCSKHWACFMCNHPEKAVGLLQDGQPVIQGHLKEKKGKWKIFKKWKTRYFTLSGAHITYSKKDSKKESLPVSKIQSVKAVRKGMRDIPKAFEIFTNDQTYVFKAKDGKNAEQWVQCLQIAVARSQKSQKDRCSSPGKGARFPSKGVVFEASSQTKL